ncbi:MAG: RNA methyltransferase, partial [Paludibacteraceae bacterium]|nr:RNA methyltransferase [Paludibacteraceae bacterium]
MALSKNRIKELAKYKQKKNRDEEGVFVAEGWKLVEELARKFECTTLIVTEKAEAAAKSSGLKAETASDDEMGRITLMKTPREAYAIFKRPDTRITKIDAKGLTLALDGVQDPGNVGTIIRTADWFGIETVICTKDCAEPYGPKVVQATMGALGRVKVMETD